MTFYRMFVCNFNWAIWWLFKKCQNKRCLSHASHFIQSLDYTPLIIFGGAFGVEHILSSCTEISSFTNSCQYLEKNKVLLFETIELCFTALSHCRSILIKTFSWHWRIKKYQWPKGTGGRAVGEDPAQALLWSGCGTLGDLLKCSEPLSIPVKRVWGQNDHFFRIWSFYTYAN